MSGNNTTTANCAITPTRQAADVLSSDPAFSNVEYDECKDEVSFTYAHCGSSKYTWNATCKYDRSTSKFVVAQLDDAWRHVALFAAVAYALEHHVASRLWGDAKTTSARFAFTASASFTKNAEKTYAKIHKRLHARARSDAEKNAERVHTKLLKIQKDYEKYPERVKRFTTDDYEGHMYAFSRNDTMMQQKCAEIKSRYDEAICNDDKDITYYAKFIDAARARIAGEPREKIVAALFALIAETKNAADALCAENAAERDARQKQKNAETIDALRRKVDIDTAEAGDVDSTIRVATTQQLQSIIDTYVERIEVANKHKEKLALNRDAEIDIFRRVAALHRVSRIAGIPEVLDMDEKMNHAAKDMCAMTLPPVDESQLPSSSSSSS